MSSGRRYFVIVVVSNYFHCYNFAERQKNHFSSILGIVEIYDQTALLQT